MLASAGGVTHEQKAASTASPAISSSGMGVLVHAADAPYSLPCQLPMR